MLEVNPNRTVSYQTIPAGYGDPEGSSNTCVIVDNFLLEPELCVDYAVENLHKFFFPQKHMYPGVVLPQLIPANLLSAYEDIFKTEFNLQYKNIFEFILRYSLVNTQPENLNHLQTYCHLDINKALDLTRNKRISGVLYLFKNPDLGGTGIYRKLDNLFGPDLDKINPPKYLTSSNRHYELTNIIEAKWNRLVLYPSNVWHSAHLEHPELLTNDPRTGRLTINSFTLLAT